MIENITIYNKDILKDFIKVSIKRNKIVTLVCSIIILVCAIIEVLLGEYLMGGLFFCLGAFFFTISFCLVPISLKRSSKMPSVKNHYQFYPDKLVVSTSSNGNELGSSTINYNAIVKVVDNNQFIYLYINKVQALIVDVAKFNESSDKEVLLAYINNCKNEMNKEKQNG